MKRMGLLTVGLLLAIAGGAAYGQSFYNKGSIVTVMPGTIFSAQDSLVNEGTFTNNGNLVMGGTWLNNGTYHPGAGEITFNSAIASQPQVINHNSQSFSKLTISGGGTKLILADITIEDEIVLNDGVIRAENDARVIIQPDAVVAGGSDQSHINAPVFHHGGGERLYPLGNGSTYLPVRLLNVEDPEAVVGIRGIELQGDDPGGSPSLQALSDQRYWVVDVVAGTAPDARIELPVRDELALGNVQDLVVAESSEIGGEFTSLGRSSGSGDLTTGRVISERPLTASIVLLGAQLNDGEIFVYNAVSPNGDALNDFLVIGNIEAWPDNVFRVFNRWGDKVFEITAYDNNERVFRGKSNVGGENELHTGTYFYTLERPGGRKVTGFLAIKD